MCTTGGQWDVSQDFGDCCLHCAQCLPPMGGTAWGVGGRAWGGAAWGGGGMDADLVALLSALADAVSRSAKVAHFARL